MVELLLRSGMGWCNTRCSLQPRGPRNHVRDNIIERPCGVRRGLRSLECKWVPRLSRAEPHPAQ